MEKINEFIKKSVLTTKSSWEHFTTLRPHIMFCTSFSPNNLKLVGNCCATLFTRPLSLRGTGNLVEALSRRFLLRRARSAAAQPPRPAAPHRTPPTLSHPAHPAHPAHPMYLE
ncbi:hypothetical protein RR46_00909 [Papilio xuthus]|uniref:Uncharacterized protein n=1 Tax=Papilio xuthus TaxID=66420 RepID=A0A0N1I305_PAPXU|nr:hypothetical protein RR46_00909 [Papilio xuthus]